MRRLIGFFILCTPLATQAAGIPHCPNNIKIGYEILIPVSEKRVERLRRNSNPDVYRTAVRARDTLIRTAPEEVRDLAFKIDGDSSGTCVYRRNGGGGGHLEIFSRSGANHLRVHFPFRGMDVFTDHELTRVNERGLKVDYRPTTPIQVKIGARSYHVGWAYSLNVD